MKARYDLAVIGSGFSGSLIAMIARRLGLSVALLEKGHHPRIVIGESTTPLANLILEELAARYDLPRLAPLNKWGTWQQTYPKITCGLKRGFSFFHHTLDQPANSTPIQERQLIVAASPNDTIADTHWYRADVDALLVSHAQELGADYIDDLQLDPPTRDTNGWTLTGRRNSQPVELHAKFLLDATGPRGYLHHAFSLDELPFPDYPQASALYSHFSGVAEFQNTSGIPSHATPYPVDAAALHHLFDGGWIWVLRFNNGITSAGVAARRSIAERFDFSAKAAAWSHLLAALPEVAAQFTKAKAEMPFRTIPQLAYQSSRMTGPGWALMPSAAGFVDPLLSTGFPLSLFGINRLATLFEHHWQKPAFDKHLELYGRQTKADLLATARLIAALYSSFDDPPTFRAISLLYFAAASYAETARRLGKPELAGSFLMHDHPNFGPASRRILAHPTQAIDTASRLALHEEIYSLIKPYDVAGLSRKPANHCYPVRAADLFASADKIGATRQEIEAMLARSGFYAAT